MRGRRVLAGNENAVLNDVGLHKRTRELARSHPRTSDQGRAYQPRLRGLLELAAEFHDARLDKEGDVPELALQALLVVREGGGLAALEQAHALRVRRARQGNRAVAHGGRELARAEELLEQRQDIFRARYACTHVRRDFCVDGVRREVEDRANPADVEDGVVGGRADVGELLRCCELLLGGGVLEEFRHVLRVGRHAVGVGRREPALRRGEVNVVVRCEN